MARMYPQFSLRAEPRLAWWDGWLRPFRSRWRGRYRVIVAYSELRNPLAWIAEPEISRRTWPRHRHIYKLGHVCPRFPADDDWRYERDDISCYLDLVVLWLGCHIHLEEFNRWPGPEAPGSAYHGSSTFRSDDGEAERLTAAVIERFGVRGLRLRMPDAGVPTGLLELDTSGLLVPRPTVSQGERSAQRNAVCWERRLPAWALRPTVRGARLLRDAELVEQLLPDPVSRGSGGRASE